MRREGIGYFNAEVECCLFPLRIGLVGFKGLLPPHGVPFLNIPEDRVIIDVVRERYPVAKTQAFQSLDVDPARLAGYNIRKEKASAVVIEAGDQIQPVVDVGRPSMIRGVVLDEFTGIVGENLVIMYGSFRLGAIKAVFLALSIIVGSDTFSW